MSEVKSTVVFRQDLPDQSIKRGSIGTIEAYDACLAKVRMQHSRAQVSVFSSTYFCPNGDPSLCPITSALRKYSTAVDFTGKDGQLPEVHTVVCTWRNALDLCERELRKTYQAMQDREQHETDQVMVVRYQQAARELEQALKLLGCYRKHRTWSANGECDFLLHVGRALLAICGL